MENARWLVRLKALDHSDMSSTDVAEASSRPASEPSF
jgi:hypothetical protein